MGLIYDDPDLAALTLTRLAAEESEGPAVLTGAGANTWVVWINATGRPTWNWSPSPSHASISGPWTTWPGPPEQTLWGFSMPPR